MSLIAPPAPDEKNSLLIKAQRYGRNKRSHLLAALAGHMRSLWCEAARRTMFSHIEFLDMNAVEDEIYLKTQGSKTVIVSIALPPFLDLCVYAF